MLRSGTTLSSFGVQASISMRMTFKVFKILTMLIHQQNYDDKMAIARKYLGLINQHILDNKFVSRKVLNTLVSEVNII
jgi:hypothetical protein